MYILDYPKTEQEIFDFVMLALWNQNKPSTRAPTGEVCRYRGTNNTKCAVGCLIPDDIYDPGFEDKSISGLISEVESTIRVSNRSKDNGLYLNKMIGFEKFLRKFSDLLRTLQQMHDSYSHYIHYDNRPSFRKHIIEYGESIAYNYKLVSFIPPTE